MILLPCCIYDFAISQTIINGSFEIAPQSGPNKLADDWQKCTSPNNSVNSPDLMPAFGNFESASEGIRYLNLSVDEAGKHETVTGKIIPPLLPNNCYKVVFESRVSEYMIFSSWEETRDYTNPAKLKTRLGKPYCSAPVTILIVDDLVKGAPWKTYSTVYEPLDTMNFIRFESDFITETKYYGHVFVDNARIVNSGDTTISVIQQVSYGESIVLFMPPDEGYTYSWSSEDVSCTNCNSTQIAITESQTIYGLKRDTNSCFYEVFKFIIQCDCHCTVPEITEFYPNPTNSYLNLRLKCPVDIEKIEIINVMGQIVKTFDINEELVEYTIDTHELAPASYFLNLISLKGSTVVRKWEKTQH
ncbi:MAG: T9SS type A sorting domain-containing protein [Bacteroidetes bacterium]|nr:MAG: T9SS type A sorting domain-containing protein [Bacteroidota bacterium]